MRGYTLRLPLDVLLLATANPEDYTNRGRIITPLKDRFGAEVRTHYPIELDDELRVVRQEALIELGRRRGVGGAPRPPVEVIARFTRHVRESPAVDQRSGVSARFAVAAAETVAASAVRRAALTGEQVAVARVADLPADRPGRPGQGRVRGVRGGARGRRARAPAPALGRGHLPVAARRGRPGTARRDVRRGGDRRDRRAGAGHRPAASLGTVPGLGRLLDRARDRRRRGDPRSSPPPALEFALEGLYLLRRLSKDSCPTGPCTVVDEQRTDETSPVRRVARRRRPARRRRTTVATPSTRSATPCSTGSPRPRRCSSCCGAGCPVAAASTTCCARSATGAPEARQAGRLDGTLEQVRELLDQALEAERRALFPNPSDDARLAEAELDALPHDTARAVRELSTYHWRSAGGQAGLRADPGPAAPRGARQPVPRDEAGAAERRSRDAATSRGHDEARSTTCSTPTRAARTPRSSSTSSWPATATSSPTTRRPSKSWSTRSPGARPRRSG